MNPTCRQCRSESVACMGRIPDGYSLAGQPLVPPWGGGTLFECTDCGLGFRHPIRPQSDYENLYEQAAETVWPIGLLRPDQLRIKSLIESRAGAKSVLDVGCYDGGLLNALGARIEKFGVEASRRRFGRPRSRAREESRSSPRKSAACRRSGNGSMSSVRSTSSNTCPTWPSSPGSCCDR